MPPDETIAAPRSSRARGWILLLVVMLVGLAPWWRNRAYVRSFFDYGVVMGGVGRIADGQRPYVDFITPIQTGWYVFNWAAEKFGDGTFQAMTLSGAACIVLATLLLGRMLLVRWPGWAAAIVTSAIVNATVAQHTLLWYNPWGVILLAVVAWGGAVAPVLRRESWPWLLAVGLALFLGGLNKINMQLMALALAAGWTVRAGLAGRAGWGRLLLTLGFFLVMGVVLPVLAEMAWTGASFAIWWHNVIAQMSGDRAGMLFEARKLGFYFKPCHDYYGPLRLPQVGLVGVLLTVVTGVVAWRHAPPERRVLQRILAVGCSVIAYLAGVVLLTTNMDIAYIALGGWLAMLVALWLGFGLPVRGGWFYGGIVIPALVISVVSWESAWRGQRSQFGHSDAPRADYRSGDEAGAAYAYFRGTHLPPDFIAGLRDMAKWREAMPAERQARILNGPGTEWAGHIWPAPRTPALPLYILGGAQFGPAEYAATYAAVNSGAFDDVTVSLVLDIWKPELATILQIKYARVRFDGGAFYRYSRAHDGSICGAPLRFIQLFGGTTDSRALISSGGLFHAGGDRMFIGTTAGRETMKLAAPTNRLRGQVVVRRQNPASTAALAAVFTIFAEYDENHRYPRWEKRVELPAGSEEVTEDYAIDSSGLATRFFVDVPPEFVGQVAAGWRGPMIYHTVKDGPAQPTWLHGDVGPIVSLTAEEKTRLFPPSSDWQPETVIVRNGRMTARGLELDAGGELWIRASGFVTEMAGVASVAPDKPLSRAPVVRGMWMKDARLEVYTQSPVNPASRAVDFRSWCAESEGWIVIAVDPGEGVPAVTLRIDRFVHKDAP